MKVIYGDPEEVKATLGAHTAYVERTNLTSRQMNGRLVRKTLSFSKELRLLEAASCWEEAMYNFTRPMKTLRVEQEEHAGSTRWRQRTPAMAAGLDFSCVERPGAVHLRACSLFHQYLMGRLPQIDLNANTQLTHADGGKTWQSLLKQRPVSPSTPEIFIGSKKSDLVYITNTRCPASQAFHTGTGPLAQPFAGGAFSLCMSSDGGVNWRTITAPSQLAISMGGVMIDPQGRVYAHSPYMPGSVMDFWRYDPAVDTWSKVRTAPAEGSLLAVTPIDTHGHVALWLMGTTQEKLVLYRYEV